MVIPVRDTFKALEELASQIRKLNSEIAKAKVRVEHRSGRKHLKSV